MSIEARGEKLASIVLKPDPTEYEVQLPAAPEDGVVKFRFSTARSGHDVDRSGDMRLLAAAFERITFVLADDDRSRR